MASYTVPRHYLQAFLALLLFCHSFVLPTANGFLISSPTKEILHAHKIPYHQRLTEKYPLRGGATSPLSQSSSPSNNDDTKSNSGTVPTRFLRALYQGLTFPFPTLRQFALEYTDIPIPTADVSGVTNATAVSSSQTRIGFSLRESILAIVVYLLVGAVAYHSTQLSSSANKQWSFVDAIYFSVVTFTTVGYGDLCPTSNLGKLFTILFGLSGISILGIAIGTIGSQLVSKESEMINKAKKASRKRLLGLWHVVMDDDPDKDTTPTSSHQQQQDGKQGKEATQAAGDTASTVDTPSSSSTTEKKQPLWKQTLQSLLKKSIPAFAVLVLGGIGMGRLEGWSLVDSTYYAFITAATLGYGDFSPVTRPGRMWATIFIPLAVAAAGEVLGNVATTLQERRQNQFYQSLMQKELDAERLMQMDTDHNGKVSREEYVAFMLQEMELVSEEEFDELYTQFAKLDVDGGGFLNKSDIRKRFEK